MKETIVIVGYGWVGQANAISLRIMRYPVFCYDVAETSLKYVPKYQKECSEIASLSHAREHDGPNTVYVVCVGDRVSEEGIQDVSPIEKALETLKGAKGTVILRSTVIPQSLDKLAFDFYVPEFLHEKKAVEECLNPYYFVVGARTGKKKPSFLDEWRKRSVKSFAGTPEEASYIKYLSNVWNAMRIAFVNEFGNAMGTPTSQKELSKIENVVNFLFERKPYLRYGKAFGGHCLPKDMRAFFYAHGRAGKSMELLGGAIKANNVQLRAEKRFPILPEWFSEWPRPIVSGREALKALRIAIKRRLSWQKEF